MKKSYHYLYRLDDTESCHSGVLDVGSCFPEEDNFYRNLTSFLDRQNYDISNSVVNRLVDFAGSQVRNNFPGSR